MNKTDLTENDGKIFIPRYDELTSGYQAAIQVVDDIILRHYVSTLSKMEVVPLDCHVSDDNVEANVRLFKINEMVYEKNECAFHKFSSVFNSLATKNCAIFIIIDSNGITTDFYMGIRSRDEEVTTVSLINTLKHSMLGQFPGIKITDYKTDEIKNVLACVDDACISSVTCVANIREEKQNKNLDFVQGLEKLALSMRGYKYTGIIIANTTSPEQLRTLRKEYEKVYTQLSPFAATQINYGQNSSIGKNESKSEGTNENCTETLSKSKSEGKTYTTSSADSYSVSKENTGSKLVKGVASASAMLGAVLAPATGGTSLAVGSLVSGGLLLLGQTMSSTETATKSSTETKGTSINTTYGESLGRTKGISQNYTYGSSVMQGLSKAVSLNAHDKTVEGILQRIDKQLKRMDEFESLGMYDCAAYFMSADLCTSEMAASIYKAIIGGINTGLEVSAVNSWGIFESHKTKAIAKYVKNFMHPVLRYECALGNIEVTPSSMVSGNELSIHLGLPRKSVCGLPVIEHVNFGKEIITYDEKEIGSGINLGKVFDMGDFCPNDVILDKNSLSMHMFVSGTTGSGKSNTVYELLSQCIYSNVNFMVIEPAKGEYKHVLGHLSDVEVYGSNPEFSKLLRINPFKFSKGIHVLEHVDRLVEIFNVCWPMYAAMPAVLKEALIKSYQDCGWDLSSSKNAYDNDLFPTFMDLLEELVEVINSSTYAEEVKSNYMGALVTRVKSLTNGLNGQIFSSDEIDNSLLFDNNVIIDLSRIGSLQTKSLIMGVLIMRLGEYRFSTTDGMNVSMKHVTVLEEAHNILKRTSTEQNPESPSIAGKSIEMISNAIAEMRTYGEGFIIVDQSPSAVDISAIRNTNTKIIMRLPDASDRYIAGKSAGLKDEQLDEIAKLPKGVAVVYQNDWAEPLLCKINKYKGKEGRYKYIPTNCLDKYTPRLNKKLLELLLKTRVRNSIEVDIEGIKYLLPKAIMSSRMKKAVIELIKEFELSGKLRLWEEGKFGALSEIVSSLINGSLWGLQKIINSSDFSVLTDGLVQEISRRIPDINDEFIIATAQCVMKNVSKESDECREIYSAWVSDLRNKGVY